MMNHDKHDDIAMKHHRTQRAISVPRSPLAASPRCYILGRTAINQYHIFVSLRNDANGHSTNARVTTKDEKPAIDYSQTFTDITSDTTWLVAEKRRVDDWASTSCFSSIRLGLSGVFRDVSNPIIRIFSFAS